QQNLGIRIGVDKMPGSSKFVADRPKVVNFSIENTPDLSVWRAHRLLSTRNIDYRQSAVPHRCALASALAMRIGHTMAYRCIHPVEKTRVRQMIACTRKHQYKSAHDMGPFTFMAGYVSASFSRMISAVLAAS